MSDPAPDLKPHVPPLAPGSGGCGCCDGIEAETPQALANRPGLSAIAYRIGDYAQFRASLHAALSSSRFAELAHLRTRDEDDFTIGLIDAFACAADVVTFYQERIANESYLRTAAERISLQEMGKLVGYRLRSGVAAETWLAFALETPPKPPATLAPEPGNFVTGAPTSVALDAGLKVQSVPGPGETPQIFETVERLADARPEWNAMRPWLGDSLRPGRGDTFTYLAGVRNNLKAGDALIFLGDDFLANRNKGNWDFRMVDSVEVRPDADRTLVQWTRGLGGIANFTNRGQTPQVQVLRKKAAPFGDIAPAWASLSVAFRSDYVGHFGGTSTQGDWPNFTISPLGETAEGVFVDLDAVVAEIHTGGYVVLAKGGFNTSQEPAPRDSQVQLFEVVSVAEVSRAEFAMSGKVTRLELRGAHDDRPQPLDPAPEAVMSETVALARAAPGLAARQNSERWPVRETSVFAVNESLEVAQYPVTMAVAGDRIPLAANAEGLLPGRLLILRGEDAKDGRAVVVQAILVKAHAISDTRCELEITPPLANALVRDTVVVHANVALASHGETVSQILGAGDASARFQSFELKQKPLTYRAAATESGAASELTVRVGNIAWTERSTMFGAGPGERAFTLVTDEQSRVSVVFGDGVRGARPSSGLNNVRASYRKGLGVPGNVAAGKLTQIINGPIGLKSASNLLPAEGGTDPESAEVARQSIPLSARTLGRAVSVLDYEDFARAFSGIAKAQAQVLQLPAGPTVVLTIAGPDNASLTPASPVWQHLLEALRESGDPHLAVRLLACQTSTFRIGMKLKRDPAYEIATVRAAVEGALRARYGFDARGLAQPVQQSEVIAVAQAVPGVTALDVTALYGGTQPPGQALPSNQVRLLASRMRVQGGVPQPAELLTLDPAPLERLEEMT